MFLEGRMNYYMAKTACEARSGYLAEVDTDEENSVLQAEKERLGLRNLWIGLNDLDNQGVWRWSRYRREAIFTAFAYNQPSSRNGPLHCILFNQSNEWSNFDCYKRSTENSSSKQYHIGALCEI